MPNESLGLVGKKLGMTQVYDDAGNLYGVTVVELGPNLVLQQKSTSGKDGYAALQLGFGAKKAKRTTKAEAGHAKKAGAELAPSTVQELRVSEAVAAKYAAGSTILASDVFKEGQFVDVQGVSKGRGFQGVFRRHNMSGFGNSHGVHEYYRHGGSIGTRLTPGMTFAGMRMPGHMGDHKVSVQNMKLVKLDAERNLAYIRGGVPGPDGAIVLVRAAVRGSK
jgi:large subunit ribosomal protein L3